MKTRIWISAATLALASSLLAQDTIQVQQQAADRTKAALDALQVIEAARAVPDGAAWQVVTGDVLIMPLNWEAPLVSGHPYSAVARTITRSPDGAHVDRSVTEMIYRDDQGRQRRELNGGKNISILDPAAGVTYNLSPETKTATKRVLQPSTIANQTKASSQSPFEMASAQARNRPNLTVEDLGTQVVNGISAQGVRTTSVTPIGTIGNDRELKNTVERWVSTDLHVLVKSVTTNSQSGATTYELTNLILGPPDPTLFEVPAGYTIQEGGRGGRGASVPIQFQPSQKK